MDGRLSGIRSRLEDWERPLAMLRWPDLESVGREEGGLAEETVQVSSAGPTAKDCMNLKLPDGRVIQAEVASTPQAMRQGLSFRESLGANQGMLFIHPYPDNWAYWMFQTLIPLDIIWLDSSRRIVSIARNCQPCSDASACFRFKPTLPALYALEIAGGTSGNLKIGQVVQW